jgi:hypothetical protein
LCQYVSSKQLLRGTKKKVSDLFDCVNTLILVVLQRLQIVTTEQEELSLLRSEESLTKTLVHGSWFMVHGSSLSGAASLSWGQAIDYELSTTNILSRLKRVALQLAKRSTAYQGLPIIVKALQK